MSRRRQTYDPSQPLLFLPETGWEPPTCLPDVPSGAQVAVDCETLDRGLAAGVGPSWHMPNGGHVCGMSWAFRVGQEIDSGYAPTQHPDTIGCFDIDHVRRWLRDIAERCELIFQNGPYDMGWLGVRPRVPRDTHSMAVLLDENRFQYNLDAICEWQGVPGKDDSLLREAAAAMGLDPKRIKEHIHLMPARLVGPYAEQDAVATLMAAERMLPQLDANGLMDAFLMECELSPHILEMRQRGIRVDIDRADQNQARLLEMRDQELRKLGALLDGRRTPTIHDVRSPRWLVDTFTELSVPFPRTAGTDKNPGGNPSFEKEWLENCPHAAGHHIAKARSLHDGAEKFIGGFIKEFLHMGRLHSEIHQLRDAGEDGSSGTKTYRFSYSNPPLQQMNRADPDRANPEHKDYTPGFVDIGTMIRECFIPEPGCVWNAPDYSQQEYRLIVHYAATLGYERADAAVRRYAEDPDTDFHNFVVEMTGLRRKRAKDCNFAKAYGAGIPKFALMTGMSLEEAADVMRQYDDELPFVGQLARRTAAVADQKGYIRLLDGRRCRFDQWEARWIPRETFTDAIRRGIDMRPCTLAEANQRRADPAHPWHGQRLKRAMTHKAGNRLIQGGSAVQTKKAMLACCREGFLPMIQMHDELGFSHSSERDCDRTAEIMREVVRLRVPVKVDNESGPDWGRAKYSFTEAARMVRG